MFSFDTKIDNLGSPEKRTWSLVSLVFSLFYFTPHWVVDSLNQFPSLVYSILIFVGFCACYAGAILSRISMAPMFNLALVVFGLSGTWVNPASLVFCGFASFIYGYYLERRQSISLMLMLLVATLAVATLVENAVSMLVWPSVAGIVGLYIFGSLERRVTLDTQLQQRSEQAIEELSAIAERERIGRDLHDAVGHSLSAVALKAELAQKFLERDDNAAAQKELRELASMSRAILSDVRKAVSGMQRRGLVAELHKLSTLLKRKGLEVELLIDANSQQLSEMSEQQESALIMIAKELVTNIIKHSEATHAELKLQALSGAICVVITDNGDVKHYAEGNGLQGIRERLASLNGVLKVNSRNGFDVEVKLMVEQIHD